MESNIAWLIMVPFVLGMLIYLKLCDILNGILRLSNQMKEINKHVSGDDEDPDTRMIKPCLKELIVNRCFEIDNELSRLRYGILGENLSPLIDKVNVLETLLDIRASINKKNNNQ